MQVGLELTTVQVTPGPLFGMVVKRQCLRAVRARPRRVLRMLGPHVHLLPFDIQVHAAHRPRRLQAQQVLIECGVLHGDLLVRPPCYPFRLPMRNPEAPFLLGQTICCAMIRTAL